MLKFVIFCYLLFEKIFMMINMKLYGTVKTGHSMKIHKYTACI